MGINAALNAQIVPYSVLYDDTLVNSIYITMDPDLLNELLNELENEYEYEVQFVYANGAELDTLYNVGFRLRGNTSLDAQKKSFKISFNTYENGRKYQGAEKLNLIGNHNDPTMSREKIYFDIYNDWGLPARRVSFVKFFINEEYFGLYTLTEEYDEIFLNDRFGESTGNLFKCIYGSTLTYNGTDAASYSTYELQTNEQQNDFSDLFHFTDVLNNTPVTDLACELEKVFNVDDFLKIYALDIASGHWDNYGANQNNYFLYHNQFTDKFEFLSYDCDNVLGVDWFGIDWAERDIYDWNFDGRPLVERIFLIQEYRDKFSYYLNELTATLLQSENIFPHIDSIRDLIAPAVVDDVYMTYDYGYTYTDFLNGFDTDDIDGHLPYGIKNFIDKRNEFTFDQLSLNEIHPILKTEKHFPVLPQPGENVIINITSFDNDLDLVKLFYSYDNISFTELLMFDDGAHNDVVVNDAIYGLNFFTSLSGSELYYYFEASDATGNISRYPYCETFNFKIGFTVPLLVINEFMAVNSQTVSDEMGGFGDYIEIYNSGIFSINLGDKFLSDEYDNPSKWKLPNIMLTPDSYLVLWADDDIDQGEYHCNFKLNGDKDEIGLYAGIDYYFSVIDTISFTFQAADVSTGRLPNGTGIFQILPLPSPGENNEKSIPEDSIDDNVFSFSILGNPALNTATIQLELFQSSAIKIDLFSVDGKMISVIEDKFLEPGSFTYDIDPILLSPGFYIITMENNNKLSSYKFIVL